MAAFSKYFHQVVNTQHCTEIIHDGSCLQSTIWNFTQTIGGCVKFVVPLSLLPVIMKLKRLDRKVFDQSIRIFIDYFLGAWLISGLGLSFICLSRKLLGYFYYFTVLGVPGCVGAAFATLVLADRVIYTYAHGLSAIAFEVSIHRGDFYIFKWLRNNRILITLAFMCLNVMLLHGLRETKTGHFYWIIQPLKRKEHYNDVYEMSPLMDQLTPTIRPQLKLCDHDTSCDSYVFNGIKKYLKFGFGLELARCAIYNYDLLLRQPWNIFRRFNWSLILFLGSYVGIYRFSNCLINRHKINPNTNDSTLRHGISSFLSGAAFFIYPNFAIFSHTVITAIEIYWDLYYESIRKCLKWIPLEKVSMMRIVFPIVFGYLLHVRAFTPWLAPLMLKKLMHLTTNFKDASIYTRYHAVLFGLEPQFSL